jgi:hypothetical protein
MNAELQAVCVRRPGFPARRATPGSRRGVALVITLVMLAVVTFMAITFLAISRRERAAVTVTEDQGQARQMTDAALARAQAQIVSSMVSQTNLLTTNGLWVSTNLINRAGFNANPPRPRDADSESTNVNYEYFMDPQRQRPTVVYFKMLTNLHYDARAPVFVPPRFRGSPIQFRYFLDLNRNARYDTNGLLPLMSGRNWFYDLSGRETARAVNVMSNLLVGDPEWIGVLQHPNERHSGTNRFIGRYAYLVLPLGKSLDINFMHNNARLGMRDAGMKSIGFWRNEGVGSWELNLAAFLRDFHTNMWSTYAYTNFPIPQPQQASVAFSDALGFLSYRYAGDYEQLPPANRWFYSPPWAGARDRSGVLRTDGIDEYADGPLFQRPGLRWLPSRPADDADPTDQPWAGSDNPRGYYTINDFWDTNKVQPRYALQMNRAGRFNSTTDRYSFYRLLSQLGTDSFPANEGKLNLNYDNLPPLNATNLEPWLPLRFFTNAAQALLLANRVTNYDAFNRPFYSIGDTYVRPNFSITNILVYGASYSNTEYTPTIHRLLQLAVNLYDASTNRVVFPGGTNLYAMPTVFRPRFGVEGSNVFLIGFTEVTNNASTVLALPFRDLNDARDRDQLRANPNENVYGVPYIIGAKRGLPNFNEFALKNVAQMTRKLEVRKPSETSPAGDWMTNQMYLLSVSNQFGIELWNSYNTEFKRQVRARVNGEFMQRLVAPGTNVGQAGFILLAPPPVRYQTNGVITTWTSNRFILPVYTNVLFLPESVWHPNTRSFRRATTNDVFERNQGYYAPGWRLEMTNRFWYALVDEGANRILDYVSLVNMTASLDITREVAGAAQVSVGTLAEPEPANVWLTNRLANTLTSPTIGVLNQVNISLGNESISEQQWTSYSRLPVDGLDKTKAIDMFREFVGLTPLVYNTDAQRNQLQGNLRARRDRLAYQAPYTPTRKLYQDLSWQVNDPLVHYTMGDLLDPFNPPNDPNRTNAVRFAVPPQIELTNSNLGFLNERYRPWGGNPNQATDRLARDPRVKDPLVRRSDDWDFPTNKYPNIGWIGRVHRGTPWQTVYLKSGVIETNFWLEWAGSLGTHPTNDWRLMDVFTVAPNDNAARGLLSVNQTNLPAWSAVLSGVPVITNLTPIANARTNAVGEYREVLIQPAAGDNNNRFWRLNQELRTIVQGINRTRSFEPYGVFAHAGRLLATPELTLASPFVNTNNLVNDFVLERIPQQILSLVRSDEPRYVVYSFGQTLKEAPGSLYLSSGPFYKLCTNYQVRAEFATKSVIRIEGGLTNLHAVVESYYEVPPE